MNVAIVFISADASRLQFVSQRKGRLLPESVRGHIRYQFMTFDAREGDDKLRSFFLKKCFGYNAVGFVDWGAETCLDSALLDSALIGKLITGGDVKQWPNEIKRWLSVFIPNLFRVSDLFGNRGDRNLLLLPNTFQSVSKDEVAKVFREKSADSVFFEDVQRALKDLRKCRRPKVKHGRDPRKYFLDDSGHYYRPGEEAHAEAGSGQGHNVVCSLRKYFRYGINFSDLKFHYNMSVDGKRFSCNLENCHGVVEEFRGCTHINIFPNSCLEK